MDLAAELSALPFGPTTSSWSGYERNAGYGVMSLPLSSGHVLALRVFPRTDFGGYVSVWHRAPDGSWAQYVDHAPVEAGCPRVWGSALDHAAAASIRVSWTGPNSLEVRMDQPELIWQVHVGRTAPLAVLNAVSAALPLTTWRTRTLIAMRERIARLIGLGPVALSGVSPTGNQLVAVLQRIFWITDSTARLQGNDLGEPVSSPECPTIGDWPLPRRPVFAIGEAQAAIGDLSDYQRLRHDAVGSGEHTPRED